MKTLIPIKKAIGLLLFTCCVLVSLKAQEATTTVEPQNEEVAGEESPEPFAPSYGLGAAAGLWAIPAVDLSGQIKPWLGLSLGYNRFDLKYEDQVIETSSYGFGDQSMILNGRFALQNIQFTAHLNAPGAPWLRLQLGAAYSLDEEIYANLAFAESLYMNDFEIKPENVGTIEGRLEEAGTIAPFLGLGLGRLVPKKRVALSLNAGVFYRGEPDITIIGTKLLEDNEHNAEVLEENFSSYKWLPTFNIRLAVRLK